MFNIDHKNIKYYILYEEISKGNAAAGLAVGGMLTALGIILKVSVAGPFTNWSNALSDFGLYSLFAFILLVIFRWGIDLMLLPTTKLSIEIHRDKNVAAIALSQGAIIGLAIIISHL